MLQVLGYVVLVPLAALSLAVTIAFAIGIVDMIKKNIK